MTRCALGLVLPGAGKVRRGGVCMMMITRGVPMTHKRRNDDLCKAILDQTRFTIAMVTVCVPSSLSLVSGS